MLYESIAEDVMLNVEAADIFFKNLTKASQVPTASFYKAAKLVLPDLRELFTLHLSEKHAFLLSSMAFKVADDPGPDQVFDGTVSEKHAPVRLRPGKQEETKKGKGCCSTKTPDSSC